jgi:hypothetical protein
LRKLKKEGGLMKISLISYALAGVVAIAAYVLGGPVLATAVAHDVTRVMIEGGG